MTALDLAREIKCSKMEQILFWGGESFHIKKWLTEIFIDAHLVTKYYDCLKEWGADSMELLELIEEKDLDFMDNCHAKLTMKKIFELRNKNSV